MEDTLQKLSSLLTKEGTPMSPKSLWTKLFTGKKSSTRLLVARVFACLVARVFADCKGKNSAPKTF